MACAAIVAGCGGDGGDGSAGTDMTGASRAAAARPGAAMVPYPRAGSGVQGVNAFDDWASTLPKTIPGCRNTPPLTPSLYPWPIITSDGQFDLRFFKTERNGSLVTYFYDVKRLKGKDLSHFDVSLRRLLACLAPHCTLKKAVVKIGAKTDPNRDGDPSDAREAGVRGEVGTDPTTGITGVKWDNPPRIGQGEIMWLYFTIDEKCLKSGFKLSEDMNRCEPGVQGAVATKAGPQDIRRGGRQTPGYAYLPVPSCLPK